MELDVTLFGNVSSDNETNSSNKSDTEAKSHPFLIYLNLFGFPLGVLLVYSCSSTGCNCHHTEE